MNRLLFVIALIISTHSHAQWQQTNGPIEGNVTALAVKGKIIFAGTGGAGIISSADSGTTWTNTGSGLTGLYIQTLVVDGNNIFAGTDKAGIFLSTNDGTTWSQINNGLTSLSINCIYKNGGNLFAGTLGGLFLSTNNGTNWSLINPMQIWSIQISGTDLFAGEYSKGIFRSSDNGSTFTPVNTGLDSIHSMPWLWTFPHIKSFVLLGNTLFAGTSNGVYVSTNNGSSWAHSDSGIPNKFLSSFIFNGTDFFANNTDGIYTSGDSAKTWVLAHDCSVSPPDKIQILATLNSVLFAGSYGSTGGVHRSFDKGITWMQTKTELKNVVVRSLVKSGNTLIAGGNYHAAFTTNNGLSWTNDSLGLPHSGVAALAVNGNDLFAGTYGGQSTCLYKSIDTGKSWTPSSNGLPFNESVQAIAVNGSYLFAGEFYGAFRSSDNGANWVAVNNGLQYPNMDIYSFALNGTDLYAGSQHGVYYTADFGGNWTQIWNGMPNMQVFSIAFLGNKLFAATYGNGIYVSTNNGTTWSPSNAGISTSTIFSLEIYGANMFAATDSGVYVSIDSGGYWFAVNNGLFNKRVLSMEVIGNNLFAGTAGNSVFSAPIDSLLLQVGTIEDISNEINIYVYPNPTNGLVHISYPSNTRDISVTDILGQKIYITSSPVFSKSVINLAPFPSGIYFLQVRTENGIVTRKIIKE